MVIIPGGKPLRIGPFLGGLNLGSDPTAIADAELVTCKNFELDIDGSLISRPPIQELEGQAGWTERIVLLCAAIFNGVYYLIGSNSNGVYYYTGNTWTLITATFRAAAAVQYADKVYMVPHPSSGTGGKWDPSGGFTAVAAIPKGQACVIHKERLFVAPGTASTSNTTRLTFSDAGNFDAWTGSNFIDVGQGDGTKLIDVTVYQDNLLLFKDQTTYVLAYDVRPTDAVVRKISQTIGVEGQFCVVNYENQVYVFHNGWVYEIVNYDFHRLNTKVPFPLDTTAPSAFSAEPFCLSILGDRLIVRYYNKTYVYGLRTKTWTEWSSDRSATHYFGPIVATRETTGDKFYAGSSITAFRSLIQLFDGRSASVKEQTFDPLYIINDTFTRVTANGWGNSDTGQTWAIDPGNLLANFATDGAKASISHSTRNFTRSLQLLTSTVANGDVKVNVASSVLATGGTLTSNLTFRRTDTANAYLCQLVWQTTGQVDINLYSVVASVATLLGTATLSGTYVANEFYTIRVRFVGSSLRVKAYKSASQEPNGWNIAVTNADWSTGVIGVSGIVSSGNTNVLPVLTYWDSLQIGDLTSQIFDITCRIKSKNFDMAVSNQFKKLWHWGADVTTNRNITGIANVIVVTFAVTWDQLAIYTWEQLSTWDQPLTEVPQVVTVNSTGTGTARRFARFKKSLRYRQINFEVVLVTDGSTGDGPARIFTLMIQTETKQGVSKAIS